MGITFGKGRKGAVRILALIMAALLALPLFTASMPQKAMASGVGDVVVSGVDFMSPSSTELEVLKAENFDDKSIFIDLSVTDSDGNTTQLLKLAEYNQNDRPAGTDFELAQIVTLDLGGEKISDIFGDFGADPVYRIAAYKSFVGGDPIYEGQIYPIYAELTTPNSPQVEYKLIGIRTASASEIDAMKSAGVGETYYTFDESDDSSGVVTYSLVRSGNSDVELRGNSLVATYSKDADAEAVKTVTGTIRYVDTDGNLVRAVSVASVPFEGKEVYIDSAFNNDAKYYRTLSNLAGTTRTMNAEYPTITVRVVEVLGMNENAYYVTVYYVDENADLLWQDTIPVKGYGYQYTLPEAFSMTRASGVEYYKFDGISTDLVPNGLKGATSKNETALANPVMFDRTMDADANFIMIDDGNGVAHRAITARFDSSDVDKALTVIEVDGSTNATLNTEVLDIKRGDSVTYDPQARADALKEASDIDYVSWSGNEVVSLSWSDLEKGTDVDLLQYAYYVPEGYAPTEAYTVDIQYMNVATSEVLKTESVTIEADQAGYINLNGPERFAENGNTYVRLAGQERGFNHSYYTSARTYTIYYRDVNDVINANTVINRVQIIDSVLPGQTTTIAATATVAPGGPIDAVETGVTTGDGTAIINDDATPLANLAGEDTTTERTIADNENPLASASRAGSADDMILPMAVGIGGSVLGALAILAIIFLIRKRKQDNANPATPTMR